MPKQQVNKASVNNLPYTNSANGQTGSSDADAKRDIIQRVLDATGLNLLQMTSISKNQVFHTASMIMRSSILDQNRIKNWIPLSTIWLEAFLCGRRGSDPTFKVGILNWGNEQISSSGVEDDTEGGVDT
jgi:hypothetical protein